MSLRALKFIGSADGIEPARGELTDDLLRSFGATRLQSSPAAYVVLNSDLQELHKFKEFVIDRGRKHEAKPLAKLLLGHSKIPFIKGSYESSGQLIRSVRALLAKAFERDDHNLYVIGASDRIFDELWERSTRIAPEGRASGRWATDARSSRKPKPPFNELSSQMLLSLLGHCDIPEDFARTFIGQSADIQVVRQLVMRAAASDAPVLILGDTGTGKEVVARSIHKYGPRASEKFVPVNCAAIPSELLESELFGHKRYTFTDAKFDKKGLWEITGNGTLFLDEVGDLASVHQAKILRALESNRIRPIGEPNEIKVNARVIAATNRNLFAMVKAGRFREDLYYRLRSFLIRTPAVRTHPEDLPVLARRFWKKITADERAFLPDDIMEELKSYGWPGNARELKAVLSSLHALFGKEGLDVARLRAVFQIQGQPPDEIEETKLSNEILMHRVDGLRYLHRVDEVLRACVVSVRPISESARPDPATVRSVKYSLHTRLAELEALCLKPLMFHSHVTFDVVDGLKEKLAYFYELLQRDDKIALGYWKNEVSREIKLALTALFQESGRLEANVE